MMTKRFLVFGAGAIGTYLGGSLAAAGHQVHFLEREAAVPGLQKRGIRMSIGEEDYQITEIEFTSSLKHLRLEEFDLAILALKTYHLDSLLPTLVEEKRQLPPLLCLQNGVESDDKLARVLKDTSIISGTVTSAVDRVEKGQIILQKKRGMGLAGSHPALRDFQTQFDQAGLNCRVYSRPDAMKWSKLITNLLANAASAILNLPPAAVYGHPELYQMELSQIQECLLVMCELGIPVVNLPGVPVRLLAWIISSTPPPISQRILSRLIGGGRGDKMPSFHIDLHSGRGKSEVGDLNGAVVRAGHKLGLDTPINDFLTTQLTSLIDGQLPQNHYEGRIILFLEDLQRFKESRSLS